MVSQVFIRDKRATNKTINNRRHGEQLRIAMLFSHAAIN
jgi:hypothetical protein